MSATPSPIDDESHFLNEESFGPITFGIIDSITKSLDDFFKKVTCSLDVIGDVVKETDFKKDYEKFKAAVESVIRNEWQMCKESNVDLKQKIKLVL